MFDHEFFLFRISTLARTFGYLITAISSKIMDITNISQVYRTVRDDVPELQNQPSMPFTHSCGLSEIVLKSLARELTSNITICFF